MIKNKIIGVVIPCFKVKKKIIKVLKKIPNFVDYVVVVDDKCPENTGKLAKNYKKIKNLIIHFNKKNLGVGGSVLQGYKILINNKCNILVKVDGDDQMVQSQMINLVKPILNNKYDYTKGNRFMNDLDKKKIPKFRFYGNYLISIFSKITTGYWDIFDYLNGFTVINCNTAKKIINLNLDKKFFFETDVLFKLNELKARVKDVSVSINYNENKSNFLPHKEFKNFFFKNIQRFFLRIKNRYYNCQNEVYTFIYVNFICSIILNSIYFLLTSISNELDVNSNIPTLIYIVFSSIFFFGVEYLNNPNFKK